MAAAGKFKKYEKINLRVLAGTVPLSSGDLANVKFALFLSTSNCDTLSVGTGVYGDLTNQHANANGYTTGGIAAVSPTLTESSGTVVLDADDPVFAASGGSIVARFIVAYIDATVNGVVKPLLGVALLDTTPADVTAVNGTNLLVTLAAGGILDWAGATSN